MKTTFVRCIMVAIVFWVSSAAANSIDVDFAGSPGAHLTIYDNQSSGEPDQVLFSFTNSGPLDIASISIDDNGHLASFDSLYNSQGVDFAKDGEEGGAPFSFSAQTTAGGINGESEFLGIIFKLNSGVTLASLYQGIDDDILKIVPDFRPPVYGGPEPISPPGSNPVPEPASLILFGIGTAGLAGLKRRRRSKM